MRKGQREREREREREIAFTPSDVASHTIDLSGTTCDYSIVFHKYVISTRTCSNSYCLFLSIMLLVLIKP